MFVSKFPRNHSSKEILREIPTPQESYWNVIFATIEKIVATLKRSMLTRVNWKPASAVNWSSIAQKIAKRKSGPSTKNFAKKDEKIYVHWTNCMQKRQFIPPKLHILRPKRPLRLKDRPLESFEVNWYLNTGTIHAASIPLKVLLLCPKVLLSVKAAN